VNWLSPKRAYPKFWLKIGEVSRKKQNLGILLWMGKKLELLFKLNPINLKNIKNKNKILETY
jgi:hypothetical protein